MTRIISLIFFLVVLLLGLFFGVLNAEEAMLDYYWGKVQLPLSIIMVLSLVVGAVLGVMASMVVMLRLKHQISKLRKDVRNTKKEVANLRSIPLKDDR